MGLVVKAMVNMVAMAREAAVPMATMAREAVVPMATMAKEAAVPMATIAREAVVPMETVFRVAVVQMLPKPLVSKETQERRKLTRSLSTSMTRDLHITARRAMMHVL